MDGKYIKALPMYLKPLMLNISGLHLIKQMFVLSTYLIWNVIEKQVFQVFFKDNKLHIYRAVM